MQIVRLIYINHGLKYEANIGSTAMVKFFLATNYSHNNPLALIVKRVTRSKYSHSAIVIFIGDKYYIFEATALKGVVFRQFEDITGWGLTPIDVDLGDFVCKVGEKLGCGYDWMGVLRFLFPNIKPSKERWFCSELAAYVLGLDNAHLYSPASLHEKMTSRALKNPQTARNGAFIAIGIYTCLLSTQWRVVLVAVFFLALLHDEY